MKQPKCSFYNEKDKLWKPVCYLHMDLLVLRTERHRRDCEGHTSENGIRYKYSKMLGTTYGETPYLIEAFHGEWNISE